MYLIKCIFDARTGNIPARYLTKQAVALLIAGIIKLFRGEIRRILNILVGGKRVSVVLWWVFISAKPIGDRCPERREEEEEGRFCWAVVA